MYKAIKSFSGVVSMRKGETREITNAAVAADLLRAGYVVEIKPERVKDPEPKTETQKEPETEPVKRGRKAKKAVQ